MPTYKRNTETQDVYARVTTQIVEAIESGAELGNWRMPWHTSGRFAFSPINIASKKPYRGVNTLCLWAAAAAKGYDRAEWGTYQQWQERGGQVRKGEHATTVVFWKFADNRKGDEDDDDPPAAGGGSRLLFVRGYAVFNIAQVDGYTPKPDKTTERPELERIQGAEAFFDGVPAKVTHYGNSAFYSRATDSITLPPFAAFKTAVDYYSTRAHETGHWTGAESRCDRIKLMGKRFGDSAYAAEELIAELSAAFLCAHLGIESAPRPDHAQYIQSWLKVLKADKRAIFTAASKAQQASDFIITAAEKTQSAAA